jgi:hypothetical protein
MKNIALIDGLDPESAEILAGLSSGIQLENFSAVTVNGIKAYKNLKTGKIIYASDFVAASGMGCTTF